jgi:hypothetical protein
MDYIGLDEADRSGLLEQVPLARRHRSFHLVAPSGRIWSGAEALPKLIGILPGGKVPSVAISKVPPLTSATGFVYGVFSRRHDSGACGYNPGTSASRVESLDLPKAAVQKPLADSAHEPMRGSTSAFG